MRVNRKAGKATTIRLGAAAALAAVSIFTLSGAAFAAQPKQGDESSTVVKKPTKHDVPYVVQHSTAVKSSTKSKTDVPRNDKTVAKNSVGVKMLPLTFHKLGKSSSVAKSFQDDGSSWPAVSPGGSQSVTFTETCNASWETTCSPLTFNLTSSGPVTFTNLTATGMSGQASYTSKSFQFTTSATEEPTTWSQTLTYTVPSDTAGGTYMVNSESSGFTNPPSPTYSVQVVPPSLAVSQTPAVVPQGELSPHVDWATPAVVTVTNTGVSELSDVQLNEHIPTPFEPATESEPAVISGTGDCLWGADDNLQCSSIVLEPGQSASVRFLVSHPSTTASADSATANVAAWDGNVEAYGSQYMMSFQGVVALSQQWPSSTVGTSSTATISVTNYGSTDSELYVNDTFPTSLGVTSVTSDDATCHQDPGTTNWNCEVEVSAGDTATLNVSYTPTSAGTFGNEAMTTLGGTPGTKTQEYITVGS